LELQVLAPLTIEPGPAAGNTADPRRTITVSTLAQMIPEVVWALVAANVAVYQIIAL